MWAPFYPHFRSRAEPDIGNMRGRFIYYTGIKSQLWAADRTAPSLCPPGGDATAYRLAIIAAME